MSNLSEKTGVAGASVMVNEVQPPAPTQPQPPHYLTQKTSQTSIGSNTLVMGGATASSEKYALHSAASVEQLPRTSDVSEPTMAHLDRYDTDIEAMITHEDTIDRAKNMNVQHQHQHQHQQSVDSNNSNNSNNSPSAAPPASSHKKYRSLGGGECQVWPGKDHWKRKAREAKIQRSCTCLSRLSKRNRLIAKVVIILLCIGIFLGIGFGISRGLKVGIYNDDSK